MAQADTAGLTEPATRDNATKQISKWKLEPSLPELLLLAFVTAVLFIAVMMLFHRFLATVEGSGDNPAFIGIASAIRHWDFHGLVVKAFWGLPYVMATVSFLTRVSDRNALLLVSYVSGLAAIVVAYRLWGGWVAGLFAVLNFDWIQRLFLGGSEPLFTALLFGSFLAARKERWLLAALLAAFSTIVRPVGIFALLGIGVALLLKRNFRSFSLASLIGLAVGGVYVLPLALYFRNPLANVQRYQQNDWAGGHLLTYPFGAILNSVSSGPVPVTNLVLTWAWIVFVLAGFVVLLFAKDCRQYWRSRPVEIFFALSYLAFVYTYNSPHWVRGSFPRFAIPVLPLVLWALEKWLPKDRRFLCAVALVSPILAACSAIGIRNVAEILRHAVT